MNHPTIRLDRSLHAKLVEELMAQGAKAIVFDICLRPFHQPVRQRCLRPRHQEKRPRHSGVEITRTQNAGSNRQVGGIALQPPQRCRRWGNINMPVDPDYGIQRLFPTITTFPGRRRSGRCRFPPPNWRAVQPEVGPMASGRMADFYDPPERFPKSVIFGVDAGRPATGFFKDKMSSSARRCPPIFPARARRLSHAVCVFGKGFPPGVEIQATATLNLIHGDWLNRLPFSLEIIFNSHCGRTRGLWFDEISTARGNVLCDWSNGVHHGGSPFGGGGMG